ncbi:MAG: threonylcarbamoyl-AMP synthase [Nitrospirae bacterium]|nr:MAG: threonylcarbamoyl-AMP synthase [Nitrospirota bacterium]
MNYIKLSNSNKEAIAMRAVEVLNEGGIVAFPTETFYGLGVKYDNPEALKRLYEIKHRPKEKALPLIVPSIKVALSLCSRVSMLERMLMERYWPGPLTIVLKAREGLSDFITAGTSKVALRIPGRSFAFTLVKKAGYPITATSANLSGSPPADNAQKVIEYFDDQIDLIIDGGKTYGIEPSTIVEVVEGKVKILRKGALKPSINHLYNP